MVMTVVMTLYRTGYRMYRTAESQVETEENVRVALNRISETIRRVDGVDQKIKVSENYLKIDDCVTNRGAYDYPYTLYELKKGILTENINGGVNHLAHNIFLFESSLENGLLTIRIGGEGYGSNPSFILEQTLYIGGE